MGHENVVMISTVACYVLATELWLPETFVIILLVRVVSEIHVILWLEWKIHKFTSWCTNYEARVRLMRHTNTML